MRDPSEIAALAVGREQGVNQGMPDRRKCVVCTEMAFGNIGRVILSIHQDVIPGFVARRAAFRGGFIPFVGFRKDCAT